MSVTSKIDQANLIFNCNFYCHLKGFPFYTLGRFSQDACTSATQLTGTCVIKGECTDLGGTSSGGCGSANTNQATCCIGEIPF